jgi:hypothetical protein
MFLDWAKKKCPNKERNGETKKIVEEEKGNENYWNMKI